MPEVFEHVLGLESGRSLRLANQALPLVFVKVGRLGEVGPHHQLFEFFPDIVSLGVTVGQVFEPDIRWLYKSADLLEPVVSCSSEMFHNPLVSRYQPSGVSVVLAVLGHAFLAVQAEPELVARIAELFGVSDDVVVVGVVPDVSNVRVDGLVLGVVLARQIHRRTGRRIAGSWRSTSRFRDCRFGCLFNGSFHLDLRSGFGRLFVRRRDGRNEPRLLGRLHRRLRRRFRSRAGVFSTGVSASTCGRALTACLSADAAAGTSRGFLAVSTAASAGGSEVEVS